jgi:uncharacterized repeat protein (TIGR04076 family)
MPRKKDAPSASTASLAAARAKKNSFELYRLKVTMLHTKDGRKSYSKQKDGTYFYVSGENLIFPQGDHSFPMYSLAALLPLLPAKQRVTDPIDWMSTDAIIADPDPHSGLQYKIERLGKENFNRANVTAVPLKNPAKKKKK